MLVVVASLVAIPDNSHGESRMQKTVDKCITSSHSADSEKHTMLNELSDVELTDAWALQLSRLESALKASASKGFTGVATLSRRGHILAEHAFGYRDKARRELIQLDTGFDIGSITKLFTAVAVLKLCHNGVVSLDDKVTKWVESIGPPVGNATLLHLLTHKSGLPEYLGDDYELVSRGDAISRIANMELDNPSGTVYQYSNAGYALLAMVIENATELTYEQYLQTQVLAPADVTRIGYRLGNWRENELAKGHTGWRSWGTPLSKPWLQDGPSWTLRGNGGLISSARELDRWVNALFDGKILPKPSSCDIGLDALGFVKPIHGYLGEAGGNDVFNASLERWIAPQLQMVLLSSHARKTAEKLFKGLKSDFDRLSDIAKVADARKLSLSESNPNSASNCK